VNSLTESRMRFEDFVFTASYGQPSQLPPPALPEAAFSGRSNVGKSSLLNKLFGRKSLARTSSQPGKTVTANFYSNGAVCFVDLPGYGYARVARSEKDRFSELAEYYFQSGRDIRLVVQLADIRRGLSREDLGMLDFLSAKGIAFIVVLTKTDKIGKAETERRKREAAQALEKFGCAGVYLFSALSGEGTGEIKAALSSAFEST